MTPKKKQEKTVSKSDSQSKPKNTGPGEEIASSLETLIAALSSHDDGVRMRARHSLVAMGKAALPSLIAALKNKNNLVRWEAAKALGEIGDPKAAPDLVKALEDEDFDIRWLAAVALIEMNIKALKPLLHALMEQGDSILIREGAHHVIHDLAKGGLRKYLAQVLSALEGIEPTADVPKAAFRALEMLEKEHKLLDAWSHTF